MSAMLTSAGASEAFDCIEPMRSARGLLKRLDGFVLVASASSPYRPGELEIIGSRRYGDPESWEHDYEAHCKSKADICWRTGWSSREAIHLMPWLLEPGDSPWEGGIILDEIITAYSGAAAEDDEAIAFAVMGWVRAFCFRQAVSTGLWTPDRVNIG